MLGDSGKPGAVAALIVAADDEEFASGQAFGRVASVSAEEHDALDLSGTCRERCIGSRVSTHARAHN